MLSFGGIRVLLGIPFHALSEIIKYTFGATGFRKYKNNLKTCIKLAVFRRVLCLPPGDFRYVMSTPLDTLMASIKAEYPDVINSLSHYGESYGPSSVWLHRDDNRTSSDPILIYLHGSAYTLKTQPDQIKDMVGVLKCIDPSKKLSIILLDYGLVSERVLFPKQAEQMDDLYSQLLKDGNTYLALLGDSAGGHLAVTYLEYLRLKRPEFITPKIVILISPWACMGTDESDYKPGKSYYDLRHRDIIAYEAFVKPKKGLKFIEDETKVDHSFLDWAYKVPINWNENPFFNNPENEFMIIYGEDETFRDGIDNLLHSIYDLPEIPYGTSNGKQIPELSFTSHENNKAKLTAYVEAWGVHDAFIFFEENFIEKYKDFENLTDESHFGAKRLVKFLRDTL